MMDDWNPLKRKYLETSPTQFENPRIIPLPVWNLVQSLRQYLIPKLQKAISISTNRLLVVSADILLINIVIAFRLRDGLIKGTRMLVTNCLYLLELIVLVNYSLVKLVYLTSGFGFECYARGERKQRLHQNWRLESLHERFWSMDKITKSSLMGAPIPNDVCASTQDTSRQAGATKLVSEVVDTTYHQNTERQLERMESQQVSTEQDSGDTNSIFSELNDDKSSRHHSYFHLHHRRPHRFRGMESRSSSLYKRDTQDTMSIDDNDAYANSKGKIQFLSSNIFKPYST